MPLCARSETHATAAKCVVVPMCVLLVLGPIAVQRCWFPIAHPSDSTGQRSRESLGRLDGTSHGELDLLVDLAGQAPGLIAGPHEVRFLVTALRRAVPRQSWGVSQHFDRAGEEQHCSIRNVHAWRFRSRPPARPALPDGGIGAGRCGRVPGESRECCAKGRPFSCQVDSLRLVGKGDSHIDVEPGWAVANKIPPINPRAE